MEMPTSEIASTLREVKAPGRVAFAILCFEWTWQSFLVPDPQLQNVDRLLWRFVTTDEWWDRLEVEIWDAVGAFHTLQGWEDGMATDEVLSLFEEGSWSTVPEKAPNCAELAEVKPEYLRLTFGDVLALCGCDTRLTNRNFLQHPFGLVLMLYLVWATAHDHYFDHGSPPDGEDSLARSLAVAKLTEKLYGRLPNVQGLRADCLEISLLQRAQRARPSAVGALGGSD
jgi:hypothetical protein